MTSLKNAVVLVERAFSEVERPPNDDLLHPQCMDDMDVVPLYGISDWSAMTEDEVIGNYAALAFLSGAGFRYFIPAYLIYVLQNPDSGQAAIDSTIWAFYPPMYGPSLRGFVASHFSELDANQRAAVDAFLEAMIPHAPDAQRALDYWRSNTR